MGCQTPKSSGGEHGADFEKCRAETMFDPQVQQAYMTGQMAKAFEAAASEHEKGVPRTVPDNTVGAPEEHHMQPAAPQTLQSSVYMDAPTRYGDLTERQQTYEEVAAYADPSRGGTEKNGGDKLDQMSEKLQNNIDKWAGKTEHLTNKLQKVEMKSQVHAEKDVKNFHSFTFYSDENGRISVSHDVERMTKARHEANRGRGILHKLDARFSGENIGFLYVGKSQTGKGLELRSKDIPEPLKKARHFAYKGALSTETAFVNVADSVKSFAETGKNIAFNKARNELYRAGQENAGLKAASITAGTAYSAVKGLKRWGSSRKEYLQQSKGIKFENKQVRLKNKIEKFEMKSAAAKETALTKAMMEASKENGLDVKFSRAEKKKAWRQVYNGSNGDGYLRSGKNVRKEEKWTNKHSDAELLEKAPATKLDKRMDKLDKVEFKNAKKLYRTRTVKKEYVNDLTGEKTIKQERVVDTSLKKRQKLKKPPSLAGMAAAGGAKKLANKAMSEMATDENVSVSAAGKGLQFLSSEIPRNKRRLAQQSKLMFEKKQAKAELKMDSARSEKLMLEKEQANGKTKPPNKKEKAERQKQARKKAAQKKRNSEAFKERAKQTAKKAKNMAASKTKEIFVSKAKFIGIAGLMGAVILILPMIMLSLLGGGGGGAGVDGAIIGTATYTNDRKGLIKFNDDFNGLMWQWQQNINSQMNTLRSADTDEWELVLNACSGGPVVSCDHIEGSSYEANPDNVYNVVKTLYGGERCGFSQYDITCLYAYFTVKYKDKDWAPVSEELGNFFNENFELASKEGDTPVNIEGTRLLDVHVTMDCQKIKNPPATDGDGKPVDTGFHYEHHGHPEAHSVDVKKIYKYYYLYPKEGKYSTIQEYIRSKVKEIGEETENGKTEGELHYEFLLESLGLHQVINFPVLNESGEYVDWSSSSGDGSGKQFGLLTEMYNKNAETEYPADYAYQQRDESIEYVKIPYSGERLECVAGGSGTIKSKTSTSVTIEYPEEKLIITYSVDGGTAKSMTNLSTGSAVKDGTHLFYCSDPVKITAHDTELDKDINPLLVIQSKIH